MPPVGSGFQSALQAWQVAQAGTAQAAQFSEAILRLQAAERQFGQRMKFEREIFELDKQKYESQLAYRDAQQQMLEAQLEQLQFQQQQTEAATTAYGQFQERQYGPYLAALAAGEDKKAEILRNKVDVAFSQLPPLAQQQFLQAEEGRIRLGMYPEIQRAKIAEMTARAREAGGGGPGFFKELGEVTKGVTQAAAGFDWDAQMKRYDKEQAALDSAAQRLGQRLNAVVQQAQLGDTAGIAAGIAEGMRKGGAAAVMDVFKRGKESGNETVQKTMADLEQAYARLIEQQLALTQRQNVAQNKYAFAETLADSLLRTGVLTQIAEPGESARDLAKRLTPRVRELGQAFTVLMSTPEYDAYMMSPAPTAAQKEALQNVINSQFGADDKMLRDWMVSTVEWMKIDNRWVSKRQTREFQALFPTQTEQPEQAEQAAPAGPRVANKPV